MNKTRQFPKCKETKVLFSAHIFFFLSFLPKAQKTDILFIVSEVKYPGHYLRMVRPFNMTTRSPPLYMYNILPFWMEQAQSIPGTCELLIISLFFFNFIRAKIPPTYSWFTCRKGNSLNFNFY